MYFIQIDINYVILFYFGYVKMKSAIFPCGRNYFEPLSELFSIINILKTPQKLKEF